MIFMISIKRATNDSVEWLDNVIKNEFPYTGFSPQDISQKLVDKNYLVFCAYERTNPVGFVEIQFLSHDAIARLSAVFVEKDFRHKSVATKLVRKAFFECKKRDFNHIFLLVKENNKVAKEFYKKLGFKFEKEHDKVIDGSNVEVWSIDL
jgi:ribosomal protein S18 acetylase RimI-like enzyme